MFAAPVGTRQPAISLLNLLPNYAPLGFLTSPVERSSCESPNELVPPTEVSGASKFVAQRDGLATKLLVHDAEYRDTA
jgi:hypothetical protein